MRNLFLNFLRWLSNYPKHKHKHKHMCPSSPVVKPHHANPTTSQPLTLTTMSKSNVLKYTLPFITDKIRDLSITTSDATNLKTNFLDPKTKTIAAHLTETDDYTLKQNHSRLVVFGNNNQNNNQNDLRKEWWDSNLGVSALYRTGCAIGPAHLICPDYDSRHNTKNYQGLLCTPSHTATPIELLASTYFRLTLIATRGSITCTEMIGELEQLFSNPNYQTYKEIEQMEISFRTHKTTLSGNRKDIISLLTIAYMNSYLVWAANPIDFNHFAPTLVIINIFLYQLPGFFPPEKDMKRALTYDEKNQFLITLGIKVAHAIFLSLADFFRDHKEMWPAAATSAILTNMPATTLTNMPATNPATINSVAEPTDTIRFFLFADPADDDYDPSNTNNPVPLDPNILPIYKDAHDANLLEAYTIPQLIELVRMIVPKDELNVPKKNYGMARKADIIALLTKNKPIFHAKYELDTYIHDLEQL